MKESWKAQKIELIQRREKERERERKVCVRHFWAQMDGMLVGLVWFDGRD